jgi:predicted double-glycine peptidase
MQLRRAKPSQRLLFVFFACVSAAAAGAAPAIWVDVPFVSQVRDGCGSAAISMVMQYWDKKDSRPASPASDMRKIQNELYSPREKGIEASAMTRYFEGSGYQAFAFRGELSDLKHHIEQGRPLIVSLKASGAHGPQHYVVVVGIDSERGYVFLNDPAQQKMLRISREGFESQWRAAGNWTLLALPRAGD